MSDAGEEFISMSEQEYEDEISILDDVVKAQGSKPDVLQAALTLGKRMIAMDAEIATAEADLKEKKATRLAIAVEQLPDLLSSIGLSSLPFDNGWAINIKPFLSASLPTKEAFEKAKTDEERQELASRKEAAFTCLRERNAESLIKTVVKVDFAKGANVIGLMNMLKKWTKLVKNASYDETVHNATLVSYAKEQMEAGNPLPADVFNIHAGRMATVVAPPKPKIK